MEIFVFTSDRWIFANEKASCWNEHETHSWRETGGLSMWWEQILDASKGKVFGDSYADSGQTLPHRWLGQALFFFLRGAKYAPWTNSYLTSQ